MIYLRTTLLFLLYYTLWNIPTNAQNKQDSLTIQFLSQPALKNGNVGIVVRDIVTSEDLISIQANRKMMPASNLKLLTAYLAMKYLPDTLIAFYHKQNGDTLKLLPNADPTLLHPNFDNRRATRFFSQLSPSIKYIKIYAGAWQDKAFGKGWMWDDYRYYFMPENTILPLYGNVLDFRLQHFHKKKTYKQLYIIQHPTLYSFTSFDMDKSFLQKSKGYFTISRALDKNHFFLTTDKYKFVATQVPIITHQTEFAERTLNKLSNKKILLSTSPDPKQNTADKNYLPFHSVPKTDAVAFMLQQSDNFFAEQLLLMLSKQYLGYMKREDIIDFLYQKELKPIITDTIVWVDGSGLSAYNLLTPNNIMAILKKSYIDIGMKTISQLYPTGGRGTLKTMFLKYPQQIFAKTGSMSNIYCLSGFFIGQSSGKWYAFSVMANNVILPTNTIRQKFENYITALMDKL